MSEPNELDAGAVSEERIEAGAKALAETDMFPGVWDLDEWEFDKNCYLALAEATIKAADAAAPPERHDAPGVSEAVESLALALSEMDRSRDLYGGVEQRRTWDVFEAARRVVALLTGQPDASINIAPPPNKRFLAYHCNRPVFGGSHWSVFDPSNPYTWTLEGITGVSFRCAWINAPDAETALRLFKAQENMSDVPDAGDAGGES